jgi:ATP-dependent DNA helicase RecQ
MFIRSRHGLGHPPVPALTATAAPNVREEIIERLPNGEVRLTGGTNSREAAQRIAEKNAQRKRQEKLRLEQMQVYAGASTCRREYLLRYFADNFSGPCKNCDNCEAPAGVAGVRQEVSA